VINCTVEKLAKDMGYSFLGDGSNVISHVSTDSRLVESGSLFVALKGERSDGHDFVDSAFERGAVCVAVNHEIELKPGKSAFIVQDSVKFLQDVALYVRRNAVAKVAAITGSYGKTTTKDMLRCVLEKKYQTVYPQGNRNNEIGLPLTLCEIEKGTEAIVTEMGMRGLGQIEELCRVALPQYGIITNIGTVHSELLGSIENIAKAKCELLEYIPENGAVALNEKDKPLLEPYLAKCKGKIIWYNCNEKEDGITAENIVSTENYVCYDFCWGNDRVSIRLNMPGMHNVANSMAVIAIAKEMGLEYAEIVQGLEQVEISGMRLKVMVGKNDVTVINDCYNANPEAMAGALEVLSTFQGKRKIAVLGDMYELGMYSESGHKKTGMAVVRFGCDCLLTVGTLAKNIALGAFEAGMKSENVIVCENNQEAIKKLEEILLPNDAVLIKGSRGMKMEEIVTELMG